MAMTYTESNAPARTARAVCTTGTEPASELVTGSRQGLLLAGLGGFEVRIESTGGAFAGGPVEAYAQNPVSLRWTRFRAFDRQVPAGSTGETFADFEYPGPWGRLAFLPNGLGQPSEIYIFGTYGKAETDGGL